MKFNNQLSDRKANIGVHKLILAFLKNDKQQENKHKRKENEHRRFDVLEKLQTTKKQTQEKKKRKRLQLTK